MKELVADAMSVYAELDDASQQIFPILYARWVSALTGGRTIDSPGIAAEVLAEAERQKDQLKTTLGYRLSGCSLVMVGQPGKGLKYLERALNELGDEQSNQIGFTFGQDTLSACLAYSAIAHAALGNYSEMYKFAGLAIARGDKTENPLTIAYVHGHCCLLFSELLDYSNLSRSMDLLAGLLRDHPIPNWIPVLDYSRAVASSYDLNNNLVVEDILRSMDVLERSGFIYWRPVFQANLARIYLARGETELAQKSIEAGNSLIKQGGDSWGGPELARVQADLMLANDMPADAIDEAYRDALARAKDYPNKFYEIRTACGFAQHYISTGRSSEARELLRSACESVTEPCEIRDFATAKNLLSQLGIS